MLYSHPITRRTALAGAGAFLCAGSSKAADPTDIQEWRAFKDRFLLTDGRVVDTGNLGVTHTEGQGWGMLFAERFDDEQSFATIWGWTSRTLRRPHDALHAWRFDPAAANPVADMNNATDGDLFMAMALLRAAQRWRNPAHAESAKAIGLDVLRLSIRTVHGRTVLLPGVSGFERGSDTVTNPSYTVFPAIRELAASAGQPNWDVIERSGLSLIDEGRFGRWKLPPDWLQIDGSSGKLAPAPNWPPRFSYDAIRVPLYLAWAGLPPCQGFLDFVASFQEKPPAWVDLDTNADAPYSAPPGMLAVAALASAKPGQALPANFPLIAAAPDYYSAALTLLARVAWREALE